jgi:hypothetical protein
MPSPHSALDCRLVTSELLTPTRVGPSASRHRAPALGHGLLCPIRAPAPQQPFLRSLRGGPDQSGPLAHLGLAVDVVANDAEQLFRPSRQGRALFIRISVLVVNPGHLAVRD